MSVFSGPEISTDGLVFAYDMGNTQKSFKGAPTTNHVTNALAMTGWNNYANGSPVAITTSLGTPGYGFYNAGSWNGLYRSVTIPSTGTYTFSAWVRYIGGSVNNNGGTVYISGYGGNDAAVGTNRTLPGEWQRLSITLNCTNTSFTFYLISYGGTSGADNSSWEMTMPQAEAGSFATPFVDGTRSNTQAIIDQTGRRTVAIGGTPTYGNDGTFIFNSSGATNLNLGSGSNFLPMPSLTFEAWIKTSGLGSGMSLNGIWGFTYGIRVDAAGDGSIYFIIATDVTTYVNIVTSGVNVNDNKWHHIVAVKNGDSSCAIYVDGVVRASGVPTAGWSGTNPWVAMDIQVGRDQNDAPYYFNGRIDVGRVYNRALSAAEVRDNFNALRGRFGI